jgi:hypothetical protein
VLGTIVMTSSDTGKSFVKRKVCSETTSLAYTHDYDHVQLEHDARFLAYFPYFEKIEYAHEITLLSVYVCVSVYPSIVAKQRLGKSPLIVARQRLGKNPPIVARKRLGRNVTAVTNTHATIKLFLEVSFLM